jgi:hypothetical protein
MKTKRISALVTIFVAVLLPIVCVAQVNSGSNGSDGALDYSSITYTTNIVINMADHPTGIYQYTYVNIPNNVTVSFIPNANNTPVYWLVQSNVVINGTVNVSGQNGTSTGGLGGPGGWSGGSGGSNPTAGQGPGGGASGYSTGGSGTYTTGNIFLIPLLGGSGGGGIVRYSFGGGGGGGAILIATSSTNSINGTINASGGQYEFTYTDNPYYSGTGSGGAVRLVGVKIVGTGNIAGSARLRFDTYQNNFAGSVSGIFTSGSQFIIIPTSGQLPQLTVTSVGGVAVSASPTGILTTPDAVLSAQQNNPIPVVVSCANLPLNTQITVSVKPANGAAVAATGYNSTGTLASSTAIVSIVIPRGGGLIYATAATGN